MTATYSRTSAYYSTQTFGQFLDILTARPIRKLPDDVVYKIDKTYEYRPDLLAFDLYGDAALWWVFCARNPNAINDPLLDFRAGLSIYIPKKATLVEDLGI